MKMKRIAVLATYVGKINRGAETFVIELCKHLRKKYIVDIYAAGMVEELKENIIQVECTAADMPAHHDFYTKWIHWYRHHRDFQYYFNRKVYEEYLQKQEYDLIFVNNGAMGCYFADKIRQAKGTPYVVTAHGGLEPKLARENPDCYVAISSAAEDWMKKEWPQVPVRRIFNGINFNHFSARPHIVEKLPLVLSVGALVEIKKHRLTIDAVARLSDVRLLILGVGEQEQELLQYGNKKLPGRFAVQAVPYAEITEQYRRASVFVLPSQDEPFGIVYLEAMAAGVPVVAPDDQTRREVIGDAGLFCDCKDASAYAAALDRALHSDWGTKPWEQAQKFDWSHAAEQYSALFEQLTARSGS